MDDSKVPPSKGMSYIVMMGFVTMSVSPLMINPFSKLFGRKRGGWKSKLYLTQDILVKEIKQS